MIIGIVAATSFITPLKRAQIALRRRLLPAAVRPRFPRSSLPCATRIAPSSVFCDCRGVVDRIVVHRGPSAGSIHAPCARNGGVAARLADLTSVVAFHPFQSYAGYRATERDQTSVSHPHDSGSRCCQLGGDWNCPENSIFDCQAGPEKQ